ncbi:hypothetical protein ACSBR2_007858 [Camellia fascicularis]
MVYPFSCGPANLGRYRKHATSKDLAWEARDRQTFVNVLSFVVLHVISSSGLNVYLS